MFIGYGEIVPESAWVPVIFDIQNDGPTFTATVEITPGNLGQGAVRRTTVELPTGTLKRVVIPIFTTARNFGWDARLLDEHGRVHAEEINKSPQKQIAAITPLVGSMPRTPGGAPAIRPILPKEPRLQPASTRLLLFPDNPLVLEGMSCLYLSSERALELKSEQINALVQWINAGGHLIVGVEQVTDIEGTPWLKSLLPFDAADMKPVHSHPELQAWLKSAAWRSNVVSSSDSPVPGYYYNYNQRPRRAGNARYGPPAQVMPGPPGNADPNSQPDPGAIARPFSDLADDQTFENADLLVARGAVRDGQIEVAAGDVPLIVTSMRGRGQITELLFSPEREPFRSWKNLPTFWAKAVEVPGLWYATESARYQGGYSSDGIFGAMLDSRQVHKLPIGWLLALLLVYLVVIGPFDQIWLKRIGRPMLTWITFPTYVVLFSFVIYYIGYKLRAGESEWNELHVVDVLRNEDHAELRGHTYASVYSPSNQKYPLASQQKFATLRGEASGNMGGGASSEKATVLQEGDGFRAEILVPVWTSQLYVSDWWDSSPSPLDVTVKTQNDGWQVQVENHTDKDIPDARLAIEERLITLGLVPANASKTFKVSRSQGTTLRDFVTRASASFPEAVRTRGQAFGENVQISDLSNSTVAVSFLSQSGAPQDYMNSFVSPPGMDISHVLDHGGAVVLAWAPDFSPIQPIQKFTPKRHHRDTLWRVPVRVL
ncbi:MAG: hypothetical protein C5B50_24175 [Verrucomicrobia bacterium]|nr:MAG: hypothetical protein C5B50_24175 [Verrucomicrobiota bacterium]